MARHGLVPTVTAGVEGISGEEIEFLMVLRKIEELYRQGFVGSMTLNCGPGGDVVFKFTTTWKPGDEPKAKG